MQQQSLVSLRLVCDGSRAEAGSSLERNKTLRSDCTLSATLVSQGVACLQDGKHEASYEGRNEHRVVYRIGAVIMKLCVDTSNQLEAACLKRTRNLEQTPRLLFEGKCVIESKQCGSSHVNCITQTVSCLLMTYVGPSLDMLMHRCFGNPYDHTVANFFVSAYQELGLMCIDGRSLMIAYSDLHTANISTLKDPTGHLPGRRVPCVIGNAEGVFLGQLPRSIFDGCCDHMLADFELQCTMAKHPSWKIMAALISRYLNGFFKLHGNLEMDVVRDKFMIRIDLMWRDICKATACVDVPSIPVAISAAASEHYATAQSFGLTIDASFRLPDEAAVPRLGPVPHPAYGRLLCGHRVNARVPGCNICKLLDTWSFAR